MIGRPLADAGRLGILRSRIGEAIDRGEYDGAAYVLTQGGVPLAEEAIGFAHRPTGRQLADDDVFAIHSLTKPVVACLVATYVDDGRILLSTPVAEVLDAFTTNDHRDITVLDLLTHRSGLSNRAPWPDWKRLMRVENVVAWAAQCDSPRWTPGTQVGYSPIVGYAVAAEVARRVDGRALSISQLIEERVLRPCAMDSTTMGKPTNAQARCVPQQVLEPLGLFPAEIVLAFDRAAAEPSFEVPGAGLWSTTSDVARFAEMLRRSGQGERGRVLSEAMSRVVVENQTGELPDVFAPDGAHDPPRFAVGLKTRGTHRGLHAFGDLVSPMTYGALGLGSTMFWVDPALDATFTVLTTGLIDERRSLRRFGALSNLAASALVSGRIDKRRTDGR